MRFREYQSNIITKGVETIRRYGYVYLAMEVRTGKTLTSLGIAQRMGAENVVFLTKKKAISSIINDYEMLNPDYEIEVINYESIHKLRSKTFGFLILDEAHGLGAFPKPSKRAMQVAQLIRKHYPYVILLSGTPTPESYSQMYHQVYGIPTNPFGLYKNFYRFADNYVDVRQKKINGLYINDYSRGHKSIIDMMKPTMISYSQKEAGFVNEITEHVHYIPMTAGTYSIANELKQNLVVERENKVILADTPVKLMQKLHQIYSGTVIFEGGNSIILDLSKAEYIKEKFSGKKIGIFYKFKEEFVAIRHVFGAENMTDDPSVFEDTNCQVIALQIQSGREGISLRKAYALVYYNIDFSATSYWQSRDRMTTKERMYSDVHWIFSEGGIEKDIYRAVTKKKDYTVSHFKKDLLSLNI